MKRKKDRSGNCAVCGIFRHILQRDHIIPRSRGGSNNSVNIQFICANCHQDKSSIEQSEANLGRKHSQETKLKISAANLGHPVTEATRIKIGRATSAAMTPELRRHLSDKGKIRASRDGSYWTGKQLTSDTKNKISASLALHFSNNAHPWIGRHHTIETKLKMSNSKKRNNT